MQEKIKKAVVDLTDLALSILVMGFVVSIGAYTLITHRNSRLTSLPTTITSNETTFINGTTDILANTWVKSVDACINATSNETIATGNYTATVDDFGYVTIDNLTATNYNDAKCTYTWYNTSQADWALANDAAVGIAEYGNWFKIIVIVGVAAVVLSLIFMAFGQRSGGHSGVSY